MSKRILVVEDGPAALEKLVATPYDGIVLDAGLPGLDGYEIARRIQQLPLNRDTPLLMVTATTEPDARKKSFEAGVVVFMSKPFTAATFRSAVESLVG